MRAITPIIAVILLVLITISAAGVAFVWIQVVQGQVASESEAGLSSSMMQLHGQMTIESVWNETGGHLCMIVRNSGTYPYDRATLLQMVFYIDGQPYMMNATTLPLTISPGDRLPVCLCNSTETGSPDCKGPLSQGYTYTGDVLDITLEVPAGSGDTYTDFYPYT